MVESTRIESFCARLHTMTFGKAPFVLKGVIAEKRADATGELTL
jgi:hypothetical protein